MPVDCNRIEFQVPEGQLVVRHACCPAGCDLMDPQVRIHDHPAIHVKYEQAGKQVSIHLDPLYGSYDHILESAAPRGTVVEFFCPQCATSLNDPDTNCAQCSAPMFMLHLPNGSFVEGCQRAGCSHHRLRIVTGEQLMRRLFDEVGMDAYL